MSSSDVPGHQMLNIMRNGFKPYVTLRVSESTEIPGIIVQQLNNFNIAYIHVIEGSIQASRAAPADFSFVDLRKIFKDQYIANNCFDIESALKARAENLADLICFGRAFLANPNLVRRLYIGAELATAHKETFYGDDAKGYTDWPFLNT